MIKVKNSITEKQRDANKKLEELILKQGVLPVEKLNDIVGDFWPENETVDEFAKKIQSNGGKVIVPKMPIPGVGYFAQCLDTEGNIFGIIQMDQNAK